MSKDVADTLGTKFQQSAPYVLQPSLRTDHTVAPGDVCPCSYPSRHAAAGGAARTFLAHFDPQRDADYRWFQDQIDYSRIYMAGHFASDISAGTLLGDAIGDYFLVTRSGVSPDSLG
jgi:membrane-associated phospholipid phosphatase